MENRIHVLPLDVINKIAAGEVVERPASIAKEFLENAIDAKATEVVLSLEKSGLDAISVSDNGSGMNSLEAATAVLQHATSKISNDDDLFKIATLGFRGEALASIASISTLTIHSSNGKDAPVMLTADSGGISTKTGQGRAQGTTITSSNIFASVPARRKFLKSEATEYKYILETFINIVLSYPRVSFKLIRNGKVTCNFPATTELSARIIQVLPVYHREDMIEVFYDDPQYKLSGFLIHPDTSTRNTSEQYIFINGRFIKNQLINKAIKEGYGTALMRDIQPSFIVYFEIAPDTVDVNVHPRKLEVRFSDPGRVFSAVKRAVTTAITKKLQQRLRENFAASSIQAEPENNPGFLKEAAEISFPKQSQEVTKDSVQESLKFSEELLKSASEAIEEEVHPAMDLTPVKITVNSFTPQDYSRDMPEAGSPVIPKSALDYENKEFLQVYETYLITFQNNKVLFIDQHAAAERVNFEKISTQLEAGTNLASQDLLIPEKLSFSSIDLANIRNNLELIEKMGYRVSNFTASSCELSAIPLLSIGHEPKQGFIEIVNDLKNSTQEDYSSRWREIKDKLIATLACHASIRAGEHLAPVVIKKLITDLFSCNLPYSCPHGRPIIWELDKYHLEKNFKRKL